MKFIHIFLYLTGFVFLLSINSCTVMKAKKKTDINGIFSVSGKWQCLNKVENGIASGVCTCKKDTLLYTGAKDVSLENLSPAVDFYIGFKTIHFEKFFDQIYFDKKLRYAYRDSVFVTNIHESNERIQGIYPCKNCDVMVEFTFLSNTYFMPYTFSDELEEKFNAFVYHEKRTPNYFHSIFINKSDKGISGCQFTSKAFSVNTHIYLKSNRSPQAIQHILCGITPI